MSDAPQTPAPSLAARDIHRSYGERVVLDGVDVVCEGPATLGLVGPNGAGKTTLLRVLAQLVEPDSGTLEICSRTVERGDDAAARRLVGWMPHEPLAWRSDSVEGNLRYAGRLSGLSRRDASARAAHSIARWELGDVAAQPVGRLSRGWAQRYSLARADLLEPPVLLLDEPTTGLDTTARIRLEYALDGWRGERIVLIASHERAWLSERCDRLVSIGEGDAR